MVRYFGSFRVAAGMLEGFAELPAGGTLLDLLVIASDTAGDDLRSELFDENGLRIDAMITVNDTIINREKAAKLILSQGDTVSLFPVFPGGG